MLVRIYKNPSGPVCTSRNRPNSSWKSFSLDSKDELQKKAKEQYPNVVALVDVMLTFSNIGNDASSMFIAGQISATALVRAPSKAAPTPTPITGGRRTRVYHNKRRTKQEKTRRR